MNRRLVMSAIAGVAAAGMLLAASPAQASPARQGLADDVYLYHPSLQSVLQKPPLETIIRYRMEEYTSFLPDEFHMVIHLYWWRSAIQLHRAKGQWVEIHPTKRYGIADLAAVGTHHYLKPAEWTCHPGRLYVRVHVFGITHVHRPDSLNLYFPWAGFNRKHKGRGNKHKAPSLHRAWKTSCQGNDTLLG